MVRHIKSLARMSRDSIKASQDAAVTIAARLPDMAMAAGNPGSPPSAEMQRMVSEKVAAAMQGSMAASLAFGQLWTRALFGGLRSPVDVAHGLAEVADAAMRPARLAVRANARRLGKRGG